VKLYYKSSGYVKTKSDKMAFRFWFLLGSHHAYLGKWTSQVLLWLLLLAWLPLVLFPQVEFFYRNLGIFAIGLPALGVLWLVADLILIPYYVKKYNELMFSSRQKNGAGEAVEIQEDTERFGYPITY
jgi:signal transduction histidine kinase